LGTLTKPRFPLTLSGDQNLDARKPSPYTSAVPETDMILDPRAALIKGNGEAGMVEDF
jgi:hypothetical protein